MMRFTLASLALFSCQLPFSAAQYVTAVVDGKTVSWLWSVTSSSIASTSSISPSTSITVAPSTTTVASVDPSNTSISSTQAGADVITTSTLNDAALSATSGISSSSAPVTEISTSYPVTTSSISNVYLSPTSTVFSSAVSTTLFASSTSTSASILVAVSVSNSNTSPTTISVLSIVSTHLATTALSVSSISSPSSSSAVQTYTIPTVLLTSASASSTNSINPSTTDITIDSEPTSTASSDTNHILALALGISLPIIALIGFTLLFLFCIRRRRNSRSDNTEDETMSSISEDRRDQAVKSWLDTSYNPMREPTLPVLAYQPSSEAFEHHPMPDDGQASFHTQPEPKPTEEVNPFISSDERGQLPQMEAIASSQVHGPPVLPPIELEGAALRNNGRPWMPAVRNQEAKGYHLPSVEERERFDFGFDETRRPADGREGRSSSKTFSVPRRPVGGSISRLGT